MMGRLWRLSRAGIQICTVDFRKVFNSYFQVWVCKDYEGWRIYHLSNEWEFIRIVDEPVEDVHTGENVLEYLKTQNSSD